MSHSTSVAKRLDLARHDLLDLTLRNSLLNFRPLKARGLEIIDEIPREIFRIVVQDERAMYFLPIGRDKEEESQDGELPTELLALMSGFEDDPDQPAERHVDNKLQTPYRATPLDIRLRNTFKAARASIEEQGVNILFLALGMLQWYESESSEITRMAPLILAPVELSQTNLKSRFRLSHTGEEIGGNLSLEAKLKEDFGIRMPELPDVEDLNVDDYFHEVNEAVSGQRRWAVDVNAIHLGVFSFSKLLIYKDLDQAVWPKDTPPSNHPIIVALFGEKGFREADPAITEEDHLDEHLSVSDTYHVVDSDSSQTLAVLDAKNGRNLVIQGPPGTGKSQTITNLIAEAIAEDKKVLFVAEKMAALKVVKRRLHRVHIGDACLELHSHTANKRAVLDELKRTLDLGMPKSQDPTEDRLLIEEKRRRLNEYSFAVNSPIGESGVTPHEAMGRLARFGEPKSLNGWPTLSMEALTSWSHQAIVLRRDQIAELQELIKVIGTPQEHIFWPCGLMSLLPMDRAAISKVLRTASAAIIGLQDHISKLENSAQIEHQDLDLVSLRRLIRSTSLAARAPDLGHVDHRNSDWASRQHEIRKVAKEALDFSDVHSRYDSVLIPEAWEQNVLSYRQSLLTYGDKWWRFLSGKYRAARNGLRGLCRSDFPSKGSKQLELAEAILHEQRLHKSLDGSRKLLSSLFSGLKLDREAEAHRKLGETATWLLDLHAQKTTGAVDERVHRMLDCDLDRAALITSSEECGRSAEQLSNAVQAVTEALEMIPERVPEGSALVERRFSDIESWLTTAQDSIHSLDDIVRFNQLEKRLVESGLRRVVEAAVSWKDAGSKLVDLFERSWLSALINTAFQERPALNEFDGSTHQAVIDRFRQLDVDLFQNNQALVAQAHWDRLPRPHGGGQIGILKREFEKKRRHLPLRKLMTSAGNAIQQIKPVFMMSPLSIAKFIPPGSARFDLVIFDEASQVKPVEAMGAILRGQQAIVVGDSKQLPPTRFFERMIEGQDEEEEQAPTTDLESILGMFCAQSAPERMLRWHYRSRHESLITVSNNEFYENRLIVFPSPDGARERVGLRFHHHPETSYEHQINVGEARAVAKAGMAHARTVPKTTLGIAAFSLAQARRIEDELEILRRRDPSNEPFFADHPDEPFFVKNLENVQGDERDVILISVGYGKPKVGRMPMSFGPLNQDGGERRLNVLITRARRRCEVYSNFVADDLDLSRTNARGVRSLKKFLKYADTGILDIPEKTGRGADSPFEEAVASKLKDLGHLVEHQVGSAGFSIDLAIVDPERPGRYLLGIECDGATYHSARSARDRDRLRQQVLEGLGWTIHRIWSTDWFKNPGRELEKVETAIRQARLVDSRNKTVNRRSQPSPFQRVDVEAPKVGDAVPPYRLASPEVWLYDKELHEVDSRRLSNWILAVVSVESPVHLTEVARRIANAAHIRRIGRRILGRVRTVAMAVARTGNIVKVGDFLWHLDHDKAPLRRRDTGQLRKIQLIAPEEIGAALAHAVQVSHGIDEDGAIAEARKLLGFGRTSQDIRSRFKEVLGRLVEHGILEERGDHFYSGRVPLSFPTRSDQGGEQRPPTPREAR